MAISLRLLFTAERNSERRRLHGTSRIFFNAFLRKPIMHSQASKKWG